MTHRTDRSGDDARFDVALYTLTEAARYLDVPASTFRTWAKGYKQSSPGRSARAAAPVVTALRPSGPSGPTVPFIGLAEGLVLTAIRRAGVPLQRVRPALTRLAEEFGLEHALASRRLYTDGAEVLFDYAARGENADAARAVRDLVVVRNGQRVFADVVAAYLQRVHFGDDGYAALIHLPAFRVADVVVDPGRGFGQPIFAHGGARLEDAIAMFQAGESLDTVSHEYGVPQADLEDAVRIATRIAA